MKTVENDLLKVFDCSLVVEEISSIWSIQSDALRFVVIWNIRLLLHTLWLQMFHNK